MISSIFFLERLLLPIRYPFIWSTRLFSDTIRDSDTLLLNSLTLCRLSAAVCNSLTRRSSFASLFLLTRIKIIKPTVTKQDSASPQIVVGLFGKTSCRHRICRCRCKIESLNICQPYCEIGLRGLNVFTSRTAAIIISGKESKFAVDSITAPDTRQGVDVAVIIMPYFQIQFCLFV